MSAPPSFQPRSPRLLNRYELLDEMPHVTGGRLFRARDLAFAEIVGVKQLGAGCNLPSSPERGSLVAAGADPTLIRVTVLPAN